MLKYAAFRNEQTAMFVPLNHSNGKDHKPQGIRLNFFQRTKENETNLEHKGSYSFKVSTRRWDKLAYLPLKKKKIKRGKSLKMAIEKRELIRGEKTALHLSLFYFKF